MAYCCTCLSSMFKLTSPKSCEFCDGMARELIKQSIEKGPNGYREDNVQFLVRETRGHPSRRHTSIAYELRSQKQVLDATALKESLEAGSRP